MMLSLVLSALAALPLAAPQDSLSEQVKEYKSILDDRERESEAIALIDAFTTRYAAHSERLVEIADMLEIEEGDAKALKKEAKDIADEQEDLADLIWLAFKERKRMTEGHRRLWKAAVFSFGQMGPHGAKHLWKVYGDKRFKDREEVGFRGTCIEQIGMTKDWDQWEDLVDLLDHHEDVIIAASATALAARESSTKAQTPSVATTANAASSTDTETTSGVARTTSSKWCARSPSDRVTCNKPSARGAAT